MTTNAMYYQANELLIQRGQKEPIDCLKHLFKYRPPGGLELIQHIHAVHLDRKAVGGRWPYAPNRLPVDVIMTNAHGISVRLKAFNIAHNHPGLDDVFEGTVWEGGLWRYPLRLLPGAIMDFPRHFHGAGNQKSISLPIELVYQHLS